MKVVRIVLIIVLSMGAPFSSTCKQLGWFDQTPSHLSVLFQSIEIFNDTLGMIGTFHGELFTTKDGGLNWIALSNRPDMWLGVTTIQALNDSIWIAGGRPGLNLTSNFGSSWTNLIEGVGGDAGDVEESFFLDRLTGVYIDVDGVVNFTTDGGNKWKIVDSQLDGDICRSVSISNNLSMCCVGAFGAVSVSNVLTGELIGTSVSETRWTHCCFVSDSVIVACGSRVTGGVILRSSDLGTSWQEATIPENTPGLNDVDFAGELIGYAVGEFSSILKTVDGGLTWIEQYGFSRELHDVSCSSETVVSTIGTNVVLRTENGGVVGVEDESSTRTLISQNEELSIYPNPASELVQVELESMNDDVIGIGVYNVNGECLLFKQADVLMHGNALQFSVQMMPIGVYHVIVQTMTRQYNGTVHIIR